MDRAAETEEARFTAYLASLAAVMGHADRAEPLADYCTGLLLPCERKSVEPMAAMLSPSHVSGKHQSLLHFVGQARWSDGKVLDAVREMVLPAMVEQGPIEAWIIDDTGFAKKGTHSVGVARQYCGRFGKTENCQIAVTLSVANKAASLPIAYRLYLPQDWANDAARRRKANVPEEVRFKSKPDIALDQIRAARAAGVPQGVVLADPAYGCNTEFRAALSAEGLPYMVGVQSNVGVWPPGTEPLPAAPWTGRGRRPSLLRRDKDHRPVSAKQLAQSLPASAWSEVMWREGANKPLASRFAAARVRPSSRDVERSTPHAVEWLLIEWPEGEAEPTRYWLSTLPEDTSLERLVEAAKLRWRIERDYEELKSELGLAHYEGRGWVGFHHHATLCIAAYGFLVRERAAIPPSASRKFKSPDLPDRPRPRGSPVQTRTTRAKLNCNHPTTARHRSRRNLAKMSMLPSAKTKTNESQKLLTQ